MGGIGDGIGTALLVMSVLIILFVPFGIWKICELLSDFFSHVHWM